MKAITLVALVFIAMLANAQEVKMRRLASR